MERPQDSNANHEGCQVSAGRRTAGRRTAGRRTAVVLVRPREEGNVGAVARAMANMGLDELVLVEPAPALGGVARGFGVGGWHLLDGARRAASLEEAIVPFHRVVGTTALRDRAPGQARVTDPRQLAAELSADPPGTATALVFGPEDNGLRKDELELCHPLVRISCVPERPTLNLAQAVLVLAWELRMAAPPSVAAARPPPAAASEVAGFMAAAGKLLERAGFDHSHIHRSLTADLRRLVRASGASSHEIRVLWRVANRLLARLG